MADESPIDPARTTPTGLPLPPGYVLADDGDKAAGVPDPAPIPGFTPEQSDAIARLINQALSASARVRADDPAPDGPAAGPHLMGAGGHLYGTGSPLNVNRPDTPNNDFIQGVKGRLKFVPPGTTSAAQFFDIEQVSVDDEIDTDDITNTSANGWKIFIDNLRGLSGQITFVYDSLNIGVVTPLPFAPRTYVTLTILPDGVTPWTFPALISKFSFATGPKAGTVRCTCNYMSSGAVTIPTANQTTPTPTLHSLTPPG